MRKPCIFGKFKAPCWKKNATHSVFYAAKKNGVNSDVFGRFSPLTLRKQRKDQCFSPPVRWGLLDFMLVSSPSPSPPRPPPASSSFLLLLLSRYCEFSVACWTPTAILRVQCGVPDPNRDPASSVWRAGPQLWSREFSVASRTPTASLWVQCGVPDLKYCVRKFVRKNDRRYVRKNDRRYVRRNVKKICQKICQKECQKICQKDVRKNVRRYVRKNVKRYVRKNGKRYVRKNVRR